MALPADDTAEQVLQPVFAASICMVVLDTFFLVLRYVARIGIKRIPFGLDDLTLCCAYVANLGICSTGLAIYFIEIRGNPSANTTFTGSHEQVKTQLEPLLKCQYAIAQLVFVGLMLPKLSLLFLYLRVFTLNRAFRVSTYLVIAFVVIPGLVYSFVSFFSCKPVAYFWDKTIRGGHCFSFDAFYRWAQGINMAQDILVLALPLYPLWRLQAPTARKLGLSTVFAVGGMGLVAGVVKWVKFLVNTSELIEPRLTAKLITWVVIESPIYLIACCLAGCGPLYTATAKVLHSYAYTNETSYTRSVDRATVLGFARLGEEEVGIRCSSRSSAQPAQPHSHELQDLEEQIVVKTDVYVTRSGGSHESARSDRMTACG